MRLGIFIGFLVVVVAFAFPNLPDNSQAYINRPQPHILNLRQKRDYYDFNTGGYVKTVDPVYRGGLQPRPLDRGPFPETRNNNPPYRPAQSDMRFSSPDISRMRQNFNQQYYNQRQQGDFDPGNRNYANSYIP